MSKGDVPIISTEINVKTTNITVQTPGTLKNSRRKQSLAISPTQLDSVQEKSEISSQIRRFSSALALGISTDVGQTPISRTSSTPAVTSPPSHPEAYFSWAQVSALRDLSGPVEHPPSDTVWDTILSSQRYPVPRTRQQGIDMDEAVADVVSDMVQNNPDTQNFVTLLLGFLSMLKQQKSIPDLTPELANSMYLLKIFVKHFVTTLDSPEALEAQFEADRVEMSSPADSAPSIHSSVSGISTLSRHERKKHRTVGAPVRFERPKPGMLTRHTSLLSFGSAPKFSLDLDPEIAGDRRPRAEQLMEAVCDALIEMRPLNSPSRYDFYNDLLGLLLIMLSSQLQKHPQTVDPRDYFLNLFYAQDRKRLLIRLFSNYVLQQRPFKQAGILTAAYSYLFASTTTPPLDDSATCSPIADKSAMLILLLANQRIESNLFRTAFTELQDGQEVAFQDLYKAICNTLENSEESSLLLYMLMVHNQAFRTYVLSRTDPDGIVIPMIKLVYSHSTENFAHIYIILATLLMMSQDEVYNDTLQLLSIDSQPWYTERILKSITLGGLVIVVLIRAITLNLTSQRDLFFHSNCVATLANMSNRMHANHPWVAQRMINFLDNVSKKYFKVTGNSKDVPTTPATPGDNLMYGDLLAILLEILTSTLSHSLRHNPQMIYAMLHKKELFAQLGTEERYQPMVETITTVLDYFTEKLAETKNPSQTPEQVLDIIDRFSKQWPANRLKPFPELTFKYQEDQDYRLFFLPYVWSIVYRKSLIHWKNVDMLEGVDTSVPL